MSSPLADPAAELAQLRAQHRALVEMVAALGRAGGDVQPVLDLVAETAGRLSGAENCYLWLADGDALRVQAAYGGTDEGLEFERAHPHQGADSRTLTGRVVQQRAVVQIPDIRDDPNYEWEGQPIAGYHALLGVPILAETALLGVLGISWAEPQVFTEEGVRLVSTFADQAAIAITNARLFAAVQRQREELVALPSLKEVADTQMYGEQQQHEDCVLNDGHLHYP
jgi:GAF domain-containing protein